MAKYRVPYEMWFRGEIEVEAMTENDAYIKAEIAARNMDDKSNNVLDSSYECEDIIMMPEEPDFDKIDAEENARLDQAEADREANRD